MKQEDAKEMWPLIKAWAEGKTLQFRRPTKWVDVFDTWFCGKPEEYRIKPEVVKYRRSVVRVFGARLGDEYRVVVWYPSDGDWALSEHSKTPTFVRWIDTDWIEETI